MMLTLTGHSCGFLILLARILGGTEEMTMTTEIVSPTVDVCTTEDSGNARCPVCKGVVTPPRTKFCSDTCSGNSRQTAFRKKNAPLHASLRALDAKRKDDHVIKRRSAITGCAAGGNPFHLDPVTKQENIERAWFMNASDGLMAAGDGTVEGEPDAALPTRKSVALVKGHEIQKPTDRAAIKALREKRRREYVSDYRRA